MKRWVTTAPIWVGKREIAAGTPVSLTASQSKYIKHALKEPEPKVEPQAVAEVEVAAEVEAIVDDAEPALKGPRRKRKGAADGDVD